MPWTGSLETRQFDADVLVTGGGCAGLWAAIGAADLGQRVVLVDKAYVSRSGCSTMCGGVTTAPMPGEDLTPWVHELVQKGGYLADQDRTWQLLNDQRQRIADMDGWGVPMIKDESGKIRRVRSRGMTEVRCLQFNPK